MRDEPAFPSEQINMGGCTPQVGPMRGGLTKRELFAAMAMQGHLALLSHHRVDLKKIMMNGIAKDAVLSADALIAELAKHTP